MKLFSTGLWILVAGICATSSAQQPNILWITSEDHGPEMGCYGDPIATTPNVDQLASRGMRYKLAWSCAPVCAPARTTIITGLYPPTCGGQHMRSSVLLPEMIRFFPSYLSDAGYYCSNNSKEDYNVQAAGKTGWAESSKKAHYRNRKQGQPFFAVFNDTSSHESKIRDESKKLIHDPATVRVPAYLPDTPTTRIDWARYYDTVTLADEAAGRRLKQLEKDGLTDDTIVIYFGDHGSGMPRSKRWTYQSGLSVPLVVYFPEKWRHLAPEGYQAGGVSERMVSFVDLAPTMLSLAKIEIPDWMQGHAFAGHATANPKFMFGFRGRMDERSDCIRTVTDGRFQYIRNFNPHFIYGQYIGYNFQTKTMTQWQQDFKAGKCNEAQSRFWKLKPAEELYDLENDPDEVNNLADQSEHQDTLRLLRTELATWCRDIRDTGFLPESEIHSRSVGSTPYEMARDESKYPFDKIFAAADRATRRDAADLENLKLSFKDTDSAVRYWAAVGILHRGQPAVLDSLDELTSALTDESASVRSTAALALGRYGDVAAQQAAVNCLLEIADWSGERSVFDAMVALNALDKLNGKAGFAMEKIAQLPDSGGKSPHQRYNSYVARLLEKIRGDLKAEGY